MKETQVLVQTQFVRLRTKSFLTQTRRFSFGDGGLHSHSDSTAGYKMHSRLFAGRLVHRMGRRDFLAFVP